MKTIMYRVVTQATSNLIRTEGFDTEREAILAAQTARKNFESGELRRFQFAKREVVGDNIADATVKWTTLDQEGS